MDLFAAIEAIKSTRASPIFLRGDVNLLAVAAGKINGKFWHFHPDSMARNQADAQTA
jgi:hypothetical protein